MLREIFTNNTPNTIILPNETPVETPRIVLPHERQSSFATIGTNLSKNVSLQEALEIGGLNYKVRKINHYLFNGTTPKKGVYQTIKLPSDFPDSIIEPREVEQYIQKYGIAYEEISNVGEQYTIIQNEEALDFLNYLSEYTVLEKVGETYNGMIYCINAFEPINILGNEYIGHLCTRNSHTGGFCLESVIDMLRIVCQNQFSELFKNNSRKIKIGHTKTAHEKIKTASNILKNTADYLNDFKAHAEKWATMPVTNNQIEKILNELFPIDKDNMKDYQIARIEEQKLLLKKAYNNEDNQNFKNSMWGMINSYADFLTHKPQYRKTETSADNHFIQTTFDSKEMMNFINLVSRIAA